MAGNLSKYGLILCLVFSALTASFEASAQINNEELARQELQDRGIDEAELERRLRAKGIDLDNLMNLSAEEALEVQQEIELTIQEMVREQATSRIKGKPNLQVPTITTKDTVPENKLDRTKVKDSVQTNVLKEIGIYGQHIFKNKSLEVYLQSNDIRPSGNYILGPGDELVVSIWGLSRKDEKLEISPSGYVTPFRMPRVFLKGFTFDQAKKILERSYAGYYRFRDNEFDVNINYSRNIQISIYGEVVNYGGFTLPATNTAFNALVAAGGPTKIGSVRKIKLRREGEKTKTLDVYAFMTDPSIAGDFYLQNNDIIQVPVAETIVEIVGEVNRPFKYELIEGETLQDAILYAGGVTSEALRNRMRLTRIEGDRKTTMEIDFTTEAGRRFVPQNGDVIEVLSINVDEVNTVVVTGEVDYPGEYTREDGMTISNVISKAGLKPTTRRDIGFLRRTNGDGSYNFQRINIEQLVSTGAGDIELKDGDEIILYSRARFADSTSMEVIGSVREPGTIFIDESGMVSVYDAVLLTGGLESDAQSFAYIYRRDPAGSRGLEYIRVDLERLMLDPGSADNVSLLPGDRLVIGSNSDLSVDQYVDVIGAVRQPGRYEYGDGMTVLDVLSLSGGFTFSAASNRIDLFRVEMKDNQATRTIIATVEVDRDLEIVGSGSDVLLQPFDQIVIREVPEFELQQNVWVEGEIRYPGPYALTTDNEKLSSVVERAGGITMEAFPQGATLYRVMDSIGYVVIDLDEALQNAKSKFNIILKDGDIIRIPKQQDLVRIIGFTNAAELYPKKILSAENGIAVPFHPSRNAKFYIDHYAAGISQDGDKCEITVEHANGQIEKTRNYGLFRSYPKVKPGSIIKVGQKEIEPRNESSSGEKEDVDWGKVFANSIAQATTILSLILLLQRID